MDVVWRAVVAGAAAYLMGAIPFSLIVGKLFYKIDLREQGSGNLGATNVYRVLGWKAGLAVAVLDVGKGALAVLVGTLLYPVAVDSNAHDWVRIAALICAVLGHSYSPYIRFRGGKGVATAAGGILFITPMAWPFLLLTFVLVIVIWRMVSLGSIAVAALFPALVMLLYGDRPAIILMSFIAAAIVLWRHRSNMGRIVRGEEARITDKGYNIRKGHGESEGGE
jgi:glycerol-3-phosphate acyltransferase PlsY